MALKGRPYPNVTILAIEVFIEVQAMAQQLAARRKQGEDVSDEVEKLNAFADAVGGLFGLEGYREP